MSEFTPGEEKILEPYFTNLDKDVFVLTNLPEVVKGALFSRYSRTAKSLRKVLLTEFIQDQESGFDEIAGKNLPESHEDAFIATQKAEDFYDRILVGYGDDSVAELAGVHLAVENVTQMIGAKALEDNRIGISPLEKSTRYVRYDDKVDGKYRYYREPVIMKSKFADLYEQTNDLLFDTYSELVEKILDWIKVRYPQEDGVKDWVYKATIRAKACDICRQLLPISTLTNVGLFGNGRSFEYLIIKMMASYFTEVRQIAKAMKNELDKVIPSFVKRSTNERGKVWLEYLEHHKREKEKVIAELELLKKTGFRKASDSVKLIEYDKYGEDKVLAGMVYSESKEKFVNVLRKVKKLSDRQKKALVEAYLSGRKNRHHKPRRALEMTDYVFEVVASIGCYKDLQRHRMLTPLVQSYHPYLGYDVPNEIVEAGWKKKYCKAMNASANAFEKVCKYFPYEAQYLVPLGYRMRWSMKMNLREVTHLTELRSTKHGHPHYRVVAQGISDEVRRVHPMLAKWATQFVDYESVDLERLESEKRTDDKKQKLVENK